MPKFYPMMMDLKGRPTLVVGGGDVAARKIEMLVSCGSKVKVVAPQIDASLNHLIDSGEVTHIKEKYQTKHLESAVLVIASTDNEEVNKKVFDDAETKQIPVNVVDVPPLCRFIVPSIVEEGDLLIAISTSGKSPAMSKRIRKELQQKFGAEYGTALTVMGKVRELAKAQLSNLDERMRILSKIANSDIIERIKKGEKLNPQELLDKVK